ncbi:MAG TPA: sulfotransferase [Candidatus Eremiobacteraceae bacterium]|nr:sulfotransferase [Candidatus Eremiobacteraceae bacterium]
MPTIAGVAKQLSRLRGQMFVDTSRQHRDSVLISSIQRSGTTWFSDVINYDNAYRSMYEPFHNRYVPEVKHFKIWQYLRPEDDRPEFLEPATAIFEGRARNGWISAYNTRMIARRRLIKDVRSLMMIGWIRQHFPDMPVIVLLRHPCAVLSSLLRLQWHRNAAEIILSQPQLMADHLEPFRAEIESASGDAENHLVGWCANYYVALRQLAGRRVFVAFYERFLAQPRNEIARLFAFLGRPFDDRVFEQMKVPSVQARVTRSGDASAVLTGGDVLEGWRKYVTAEQTDRALALLRRFGLDAIYGAETMPLVSDLTAFGIPAGD